MKAVILGTTGYTGMILLRLLADHPDVDEIIPVSSSRFGQPAASVDPGIGKAIEKKLGLCKGNLVTLEEAIAMKPDVVFAGLPHLESAKICQPFFGKSVVIDLSADFRIKDHKLFAQAYGQEPPCPELLPQSVYGLCEVYGDQIKKADITDEDAIGHDPIRITYGWTGGGYLNLNLDLSFKKESTTKHVVNLVLANPPVQEDTLRLAIRHNGASEALTTDILNQDTDGQWNKTYAFGSSLVCFPTEGLLPEGTDQIPFAITGEWYSQNAETREWTLKESRVTGLLKR